MNNGLEWFNELAFATNKKTNLFKDRATGYIVADL